MLLLKLGPDNDLDRFKWKSQDWPAYRYCDYI